MTQETITLVNQITEDQRAANRAEYAAVKAIWKKLADARTITCQDVAALCLYKSIKLGLTDDTKARLHRSFKPITNQIKLQNGCTPFEALEKSLRWLKYSEFAKQLPEETQKQMEALAKETLSKGLT